jgi:hypothetical protein
MKMVLFLDRLIVFESEGPVYHELLKRPEAVAVPHGMEVICATDVEIGRVWDFVTREDGHGELIQRTLTPDFVPIGQPTP